MKKATIWLIVLILALNGCNKEDIIATTAKEFNVELVSTNVTDGTPYYDSTILYDDGDIVREDDSIYSTSGGGLVDFNNGEGLFIDDIFESSSQKYKVIKKYVDESPNAENSVVDGRQDYRKDISGFPATNFYTIGGSDTVTFTQVSGTLWNKVVTGTGGYSMQVTIHETWEPGYQDQEYFIFGGDLYRKTITHNWIGNTRYYTTTSDYMKPNLVYLRPVNQLLPFDDMNTSYATATNTMTYTIKALQSFNSFTLAGVTADILTYTIKDSLAVVVKTDTIVLDCDLDDDGLLPQGEITKLISAGETVEANGTIEISLTSTGEVKLGTFMTNIAIDEGATEMLIKAGFRDTNSYAEDPWGNIEEGVKPITRKFDIAVIVEYAKFDKTYRRHKSFLGKFITLDGTDATLTENGLTLHSLVARGLIISVGHETLKKDNDMKPYYKYNMSFLEIV